MFWHPQWWTAAFALGFSKAWELMLPLMKEGYRKAHETIFADAIDQAMANLEGVIAKRLETAEKAHLRPANTLLAKRDEFRKKAALSVDGEAKLKYEHYATALDWALELDGH